MPKFISLNQTKDVFFEEQNDEGFGALPHNAQEDNAIALGLIAGTPTPAGPGSPTVGSNGTPERTEDDLQVWGNMSTPGLYGEGETEGNETAHKRSPLSVPTPRKKRDPKSNPKVYVTSTFFNFHSKLYLLNGKEIELHELGFLQT